MMTVTAMKPRWKATAAPPEATLPKWAPASPGKPWRIDSMA